MPHPIRAIVNPAAGSGRTRACWPRVASALRDAGLEFDVAFTAGPGEATVLTREALRSGVGTVLAVGGDGTVNEVVNGFFDQCQPIAPETRLGVICSGTGSDLIRTLGLPRGPAAVDAIAVGKTLAIDLGWAEYTTPTGERAARYFANVADLGLGGETARRVNQSSKALGGFVSFLWGVITTTLAYQPKRVTLQIDDAAPFEKRITTVIAANCRYLGGGMFIAPTARPDDGKLDVLVLEAVSKHDLIFNLLPRVYFGKHLSHPRVTLTCATRLRVSSEEAVLLELDGEQPGQAAAEMRVVPRALNVIVGSQGKRKLC